MLCLCLTTSSSLGQTQGLFWEAHIEYRCWLLAEWPRPETPKRMCSDTSLLAATHKELRRDFLGEQQALRGLHTSIKVACSMIYWTVAASLKVYEWLSNAQDVIASDARCFIQTTGLYSSASSSLHPGMHACAP